MKDIIPDKHFYLPTQFNNLQAKKAKAEKCQALGRTHCGSKKFSKSKPAVTHIKITPG